MGFEVVTMAKKHSGWKPLWKPYFESKAGILSVAFMEIFLGLMLIMQFPQDYFYWLFGAVFIGISFVLMYRKDGHALFLLIAGILILLMTPLFILWFYAALLLISGIGMLVTGIAIDDVSAVYGIIIMLMGFLLIAAGMGIALYVAIVLISIGVLEIGKAYLGD